MECKLVNAFRSLGHDKYKYYPLGVKKIKNKKKNCKHNGAICAQRRDRNDSYSRSACTYRHVRTKATLIKKHKLIVSRAAQLQYAYAEW